MLTRRHLLSTSVLGTVSLVGSTIPARASNAAREVRPAFGVGVSTHTTAPRAAVAPNTYAATLPDVGPGAGWQDVRALQYLLLARGYKTASWETTYGPDTRAAVLAFQRRYSLPGAGVAVSSTMARLTDPTSVGQNTYRTFAIQTLLKKHGYRFGEGAAAAMTTAYDGNTDALVQTFQTAHGLGALAQAGPLTWSTLFAAATAGPVYPLAQADTGRAQWNNCGPVSAVALLISRGVVPARWTWNAASVDAAASINAFRYQAMGVAATPSRDSQGTSVAELTKGLAVYGYLDVTWQLLSAGLADVRAGSGILLSGDAYRLPWPTRTRGPAGHWITVVGFDGVNYLAVDPISAVGATVLHRISAAQLGVYVSGKYGNTTSSRSSLLVH